MRITRVLYAPKSVSPELVEEAKNIILRQIADLDEEAMFEDGWLQRGNPNTVEYRADIIGHDYPGRWPEKSGADEEYNAWPREEPIVLALENEYSPFYLLCSWCGSEADPPAKYDEDSVTAYNGLRFSRCDDGSIWLESDEGDGCEVSLEEAKSLILGEPVKRLGKIQQEMLWLTPAEAAALTGTGESTWRGRCWRGQIPGAVKKGKQWLIPKSSISKPAEPAERGEMRNIETTYNVQHGSNSTLRVADENAWYVVRQAWERQLLLNSTIVSKHVSEDEARAEMARLEKS